MTESPNLHPEPPVEQPVDQPVVQPAVPRARWRDRSLGFRGVVATAVAGVLVGGLAGTALGFVLDDDHDHRGPGPGFHGPPFDPDGARGAVPPGSDQGTAGSDAAAPSVDWPFPTPGRPGGGFSGYQLDAGSAALDVSDATAAQSSGVVLVSTVVDFGAGEAAGTGLVIDSAAGVVVTNHHVVDGATEVTVTDPATGATYDAEVLGSDARHDVAVLKIEDASALAEVTASTDPVAVGDAITAVGDAGGDGGALTAAPGTVTDAHEPVTVTEDDGTEATIRNLIEVDADIIAGDSGGALLDADGDVVGMNVAASTGSADITGYAIPIHRVLRIADAVLAGDDGAGVTLGYDAFLGVQLGSAGGAATVTGVLEDSAAAAAGLTTGDTITAVGGAPTATVDAVSRAIAAHDAGDRVTIRWTDAAGGTHHAEVTLGRAPVA